MKQFPVEPKWIERIYSPQWPERSRARLSPVHSKNWRYIHLWWFIGQRTWTMRHKLHFHNQLHFRFWSLSSTDRAPLFISCDFDTVEVLWLRWGFFFSFFFPLTLFQGCRSDFWKESVPDLSDLRTWDKPPESQNSKLRCVSHYPDI